MAPKIFEFGECILDCDRFELTRRGHRVKIERKPMQLLILLVTRQGSLVTRDEIAGALWEPNVFVDVNPGINTLIRKIRYALRDEAEEPRFVETVPGKGYRFVSEVIVKERLNGHPVNGVGAATTVVKPEPVSSSGAPPTQVVFRSANSGGVSRFVWLGIACFGILAAAEITIHWLQNRRHRVEYTQLTNFADSASAPSLSPDGRMLSFIRGSDSFLSTDQIYVKMLPNGEAKRLTDDTRWKYRPVFSPDGSQIAYTVISGTSFDTQVVPVFGGESRLLLRNAAGLSWLGADEILFSRLRSELHMGVARGKLTSQQFHDLYFPVSNEEMVHYSFASPDHTAAVLVQMAEDGSWTQCRLISLESRFTWRFVGPEGSCNAAAWSPDGSWMYFTVTRGGQSHLWRQAYPKGTPEQITFGPAEEQGLAMEPDGKSVITSFGVRQTSLWLHEPAGDRALAMEGDVLGSRIEETYGPSISRDGKFIYYLSRQHPDSEPELSRIDLTSGRSETVFPGVPMHDYDVSADGRRILYSCSSAKEAADLCIASLDRSSLLHRISVPGATYPRFGAPGKLFFDSMEGKSGFFEEIDEDGSGRRKVLSAPVFDWVLISPSRRWLMTCVNPSDSDYQFRAFSLRGDAPKTYCSTPCYPYWSPDGTWLYVPVEHAAGTNSGRSLAIPVGPGETLPDFPPGGIKPGAQPSEIAGALSVNRQFVIPGADPAHYAYLSVVTQRNLYRITLP